MGPAHPVCPRAKGRTHPEEHRPSGTALPGPGRTTVAFLCPGGDGPWERPVRVCGARPGWKSGISGRSSAALKAVNT